MLAWCALLLLPAVASGAQTTREYRSNAVGLRVGPASEGGADDFLLRVRSTDGTEESVLLEQGREVRRIVRVTDPSNGRVSETVHEDGEVTAARLFDAQMRLLEEQTAGEKRVYRYRGELLETLEVSAAGGEPLYVERYGYTSRGRLREVDRWYADGSRSLSSFLFVEGRLLGERLQAEPGVLTARYDDSGRLVAESERRDGRTLWERTHSYDPATGRRKETVEQRADHAVRRIYDADGRIAEEIRSGSDPYRSAYAYDGEGRQIRLRRVGAIGSEEWLTEYDEEGRPARESYLWRGVLRRVRVHTGERQWHDDLYRDGRAVLRVFYSDDQRSGEERLP